MPILPSRAGFLIVMISISIAGVGRSGGRRLEMDRSGRPDAAGRKYGPTSSQVDRGAKQDRHHAAEAVEEGLGDAVDQEGYADGEPADQDGGGAERGTQLNRSGLQPCGDSHSDKKSYKTLISKSQP